MIDFNYTTTSAVLKNEVDLVLEQLDMLLDTDKHEVLGDPNYGSDFDIFIHELNTSNRMIKQYITSTITQQVDLMGFTLDVNVEILQGTENDIILVQLDLSKDGENFQRTFKIE